MLSHLEEGVSLSQVSPNLDFWLDALDVGWGAHVGDDMVSGRCSPQEADLSINVRELLASRLNCSIVCGTTRLPLLTFTIKGHSVSSGGQSLFL